MARWLAMDPIYFGDKGQSENGKQIRKSPYDLRCELLENLNADDKNRLYKIGRALYHLVQRRGFKTSRKSGKSSYGESEILTRFHEKYPDRKEWKSSQVFNFLQSDTCTDAELKLNRIRKDTGVLQRIFYEQELAAICEKQHLSKELSGKLHDAIYFVRGPRGQKGLVGKCTLEKGKPRIPISHPAFEEFRALQFINNIQWRETGSKKSFEPIPMQLKKKILEELFFRKVERGPNKGKVTTDGHFKFDELINRYSENGKFEFNYKNKPNVPICPVIAGLMNVFAEEWEDKFFQGENKFGINWGGLSLNYKIKYGTRKAKWKNGKRIFVPKEVGKEKDKSLNYEDIWHLLFDFIQTKDKEDALKTFCNGVLEWDDKKADEFADINIQQGYGSLSRSAIVKILPYLQEGHIYSEAVSFANLSKVLGKENFLSQKESAKKSIADTIGEVDNEKEKLNIINGLIQNYFGDIEAIKTKGLDKKKKDETAADVEKKLKNYFGEGNWNDKSEADRKEYFDFVLNKYLRFLNSEQESCEKASSKPGKEPEQDYYKLPRLDEAIKQVLRDKFSATEKGLKYLYHPSDIEIYPRADFKKIVDKQTGEIIREVFQLGSPQPPSKGWKNPMAMRTMYELRKLVNYLLETGTIDEETKIVVEMARDLNNANMRKAIEDWQNDRREENEEYAKAIAEMYGIGSPSDDDYNKFKAAVEQITKSEFSDNKEKEFKKKYNEFIQTFLVGKKNGDTKQDEDEDAVANSAEEESTDEVNYEYLMYLILNRDNFVQLLNSKIPNSNKFVRQIIRTTKGFKEKRKALKEMLTKYRLWKQQKFQCFYTGQQIPFSKLFTNDYQVEHTIPRSISFDSELKNLTVCDAIYNNYEKNNQFPTECKNYKETKKCRTVNGEKECSPIIERIERLIKPKVDELQKRIDGLELAAKKIPDWEVDKKNANIHLRHYLQFELDYWDRKYFTFTVERKDWKDKWKNSQLVDTQIITKYARAYMKSLFHHVDVQKGITTSEFKKIYGIMGDEQKDRSRHTHHAMDAAVLTLIPGSARREEILRRYFLALESKRKFHTKPYSEFDITHVTSIDENVLVNHVNRDRTIIPTYKKIRKRGIVQLTEAGTEMVMEGDSVRGQLHDETFLGAIKVPERNKEGYAIKKDGKYLVQKNKKTGEDEIWIVSRKLIEIVDLKKDKIVDEPLKIYIQKQLEDGTIKSITEATDFQGRRIRHLRCAYKAGRGYLTPSKAIELKAHSHQPKQLHKQFVLVKNSTEGNYLYLLYESEDNGDVRRRAQIINLVDFCNKYGFSNIKEIWENKALGQSEDGLPLKYILRAGLKVIFYATDRKELANMDEAELRKRVFLIYKFNESGTPDIYLKNPVDARPNPEIDKLCENSFDPNKYQAGLSLKAAELNCIFEGADFVIKPDGSINFNS